MNEVMPLPTTEKWKEILQEFWKRCGFPNCRGAIDGKRITIQAPANSGSFFNYKKTFSIVLLALDDANYNFIMVDVGAYARNSDGGILSQSNIGKALENGNLKVPPDQYLPGITQTAPCVTVGDEAFPLKRYLMRPFHSSQLDDEGNKNFNYRLTLARCLVECTFGILSQTFRMFNRRIQLTPQNVDYVILATCVPVSYTHLDVYKRQPLAVQYPFTLQGNRFVIFNQGFFLCPLTNQRRTAR